MEKKKTSTLLDSFKNLTGQCDEHEFCSDCELYFETGICPIDTLKEVSDERFIKRLEELAKK